LFSKHHNHRHHHDHHQQQQLASPPLLFFLTLSVLTPVKAVWLLLIMMVFPAAAHDK
jgi:hypothetical protein